LWIGNRLHTPGAIHNRMPHHTCRQLKGGWPTPSSSPLLLWPLAAAGGPAALGSTLVLCPKKGTTKPSQVRVPLEEGGGAGGRGRLRKRRRAYRDQAPPLPTLVIPGWSPVVQRARTCPPPRAAPSQAASRGAAGRRAAWPWGQSPARRGWRASPRPPPYVRVCVHVYV